MENLPDEVVSEIFMRLLAKQLAQMRCVCKSWNALLSDPSFVKSHLHHSLHNNDQILLFFGRFFMDNNNSITARPTHSPNLELRNFIKPPFNPQYKERYGNVIGSVNGLICFFYWTSPGDFVLHIWNPSLSAMSTLPPCSLPFRGLKDVHLRFGYDPKTDDYKVVKFTSHSETLKMVAQGEVYSMRRRSWELISQLFPANISYICDRKEVCRDGHDGNLHWLGYIDDEWKAQAIVAFNLGVETFRVIPLPHSITHHHGYRWNVLGVLDGKLCVMSRAKSDIWEVWVMNEYGVAHSWVKSHVVSLDSGYIDLYGFTSHTEILFRGGGHFGLYDPVAAMTKTFIISGGQFGIMEKVVEYVDSLVWVAPASISQLQF